MKKIVLWFSIQAYLPTMLSLTSCIGRLKSPLFHRQTYLKMGYNNFSLMVNTPIIIRGVEEIIDKYDIFLLDQFGVLHDGVQPIRGAINAVDLLKKKNKSIIVVYNTSSRTSTASKKFVQMGFPDSIQFVTSGEVAWRYIEENFLGGKCAWITWRSHGKDDYLKSLGVQLASVHDADFLFFHGTQVMATADRDVLDLSTTSSDLPLSLFSSGILDDSLREAFSTAIARGIPAICANMDNSAVLANGRSAYMPGLLKAAYEEMGGVVISFGKPQKAFFDVAVSLGTAAMNISSSPSTTRKLRPRVIHVGDSLHHDIAGAINTGIDSILVTEHGVHRHELRSPDGIEELAEADLSSCESKAGSGATTTPLLMKVTDLCDREGTGRPYFILRSFVP